MWRTDFTEGSMENKHMKKWTEIFKQLSLLSQFGLTLIIPPVLCLGLCWWLAGKFGLGAWIYIPGFVFGLGASFMTAYKFYVAQTRGQERKSEEKKNKHSFNKHM